MTVRTGNTYDVFLSHASEDKADVVLPLAELLGRRNVRVWLDQQQLQLGDSLSQKIDEGLAESRFGVVVLSPAFLGKEWPERELDGLVARETIFGNKVILPVWHNVTREQIAEYSAPLAGKLAASTEGGLEAIADQILKVLKRPAPDARQVAETDGGEESANGSDRVKLESSGPIALNDETSALIRARDEMGLDELLRAERREWERMLNATFAAYRQARPDVETVRSAWVDIIVGVERRAATLLPLGAYDVPRFNSEVRAMARALELRPRLDGYVVWNEMAELASTCVGYIVGSWLIEVDKFEGITSLLGATWDYHGLTEKLVWLPGEAQTAVGLAMMPPPTSGGQWRSPFWEYLKGLLPTIVWLADRYPEMAGTPEAAAAALSTFDLLVCFRAVFSGNDGAVAWFDLYHPSQGASGPVRFARRLVNDDMLRDRVAVALAVDIEKFRRDAAEVALKPEGWRGHHSERDKVVDALRSLRA